MTYRTSLAAAAAISAFTLALAGGVVAAEHTPAGIAYEQGGIGLEEIQAMEAASHLYSLRVRTAARGSGAYLADVDLAIRDASGNEVFHRQLEAPWLLIDLPPGRYEIVGVHDGIVTRQTVTLASHAHRDALLYFAVEGEVRPHRADED